MVKIMEIPAVNLQSVSAFPASLNRTCWPCNKNILPDEWALPLSGPGGLVLYFCADCAIGPGGPLCAAAEAYDIVHRVADESERERQRAERIASIEAQERQRREAIASARAVQSRRIVEMIVAVPALTSEEASIAFWEVRGLETANVRRGGELTRAILDEEQSIADARELRKTLTAEAEDRVSRAIEAWKEFGKLMPTKPYAGDAMSGALLACDIEQPENDGEEIPASVFECLVDKAGDWKVQAGRGSSVQSKKRESVKKLLGSKALAEFTPQEQDALWMYVNHATQNEIERYTGIRQSNFSSRILKRALSMASALTKG